jgi:hypothetical protein
MTVDWVDFGRALALYFVIEGILPFLSPATSRRAAQLMADAGPLQLRIVGLGSMLGGLAILYALRA